MRWFISLHCFLCFIIFNALFIVCGALFIRCLFVYMRCYLHYRRYFVRSVQTSLYSVLSLLHSVIQYFWSSALQRETAPSLHSFPPCFAFKMTAYSRQFRSDMAWLKPSLAIMELILTKLNLETLIERFQTERSDQELVFSMSDGNFASLSVSKIRDRVRLRKLCAKALEKTRKTANYREQVREERNILFHSDTSFFKERPRHFFSAVWNFFRQFCCVAHHQRYRQGCNPASLQMLRINREEMHMKSLAQKYSLTPDDVYTT